MKEPLHLGKSHTAGRNGPHYLRRALGCPTPPSILLPADLTPSLWGGSLPVGVPHWPQAPVLGPPACEEAGPAPHWLSDCEPTHPGWLPPLEW